MQAERNELEKVAQEIAKLLPVKKCPWNPFPHDSEWGRMFDEMYERERARRLLERRIFARKPAPKEVPDAG